MNKLQKIKNKIEKLHKELEKESGDQTLTCDSCKKDERITNITVIDKLYYVKPHGCTEGDYYTTSEYQTVCSHCNKRTRYIEKEDKEFINKNIYYFAQVLNWHDEPDDKNLVETLEAKEQKRVDDKNECWY